MKNITTSKDLEIAVTAIVAGYELNDPINEDYQLQWSFVELNTLFAVSYVWIKGIIEDSENDPTIRKDSEIIADTDLFSIYKTASYSELASKVNEAIQQVTSKEFEVLKFSETI